MNFRNGFQNNKCFALVLALAALAAIGANWGSLHGRWKAMSYQPRTRTYYVAAENVTWDYAPTGLCQPEGAPLPKPWGEKTKYAKAVYVAYTDDTFTTKVPQPKWLGILGPVIRGVPGDTIKVVFYNKADKPYSIHPHGVFYDMDNEGASMSSDALCMPEGDKPGSTAMPMPAMPKGAQIPSGGKYTYTWTVRDDAAPTAQEGGSKVWLYHSHVDSVQDIYDGLVGPIVITSREHANADATPDDVDEEFVTLFLIFDESKPGMTDEEKEASQKHTINGYFFGNLRGLTMKAGERVRWYVAGLGNEVDLHTPHWHGNVVKGDGPTTDVLEILPGSMHTVNMVPDDPGTWMYHCHVADHMKAGMFTTYTVTK